MEEIPVLKLDELPEIRNGNPLLLILAVPVFFLVWYFIGIGYAFIAGPGALAICFVLFIWIPDDSGRKLTRIMKFNQERKILDFIRTKQLRMIKDHEVVPEVNKGLLTFEGLMTAFQKKNTVQGKTEEKMLPVIKNVSNLLTELLGDETGMFPLEDDRRTKIRGILLHFDDLMIEYQKNSIDTSDTLSSQFELETDMESAGINHDAGAK